MEAVAREGGMIRHFVSSVLMGLLVASNGSVLAQEAVRLYAAGSLRVALTEVAVAFEKQEGIPVATEFGASGLLRERIEKGAPAEVFASADMGHRETLHCCRRRCCNWATSLSTHSPKRYYDRTHLQNSFS
jgi:ABC-type molybdate transport system substrate-binding protein